MRWLPTTLSVLVAATAAAGVDEPAPMPMTTEAIYTPATLSTHINGGAELFLEFGFEEMQLLTSTADEVELTAELYRMRDPEAALGIYLAK